MTTATFERKTAVPCLECGHETVERFTNHPDANELPLCCWTCAALYIAAQELDRPLGYYSS